MIHLYDDLYHFIHDGVSPWHAAREIANRLAFQGFSPLCEEEPWELKKGEKYFVQRGASILAFKLPSKGMERLLVFGSHTDSPCLKLKPKGFYHVEDMVLCGTEVYGGVNLPTWLDRDLAIAGQIIVKNEEGALEEHLIYLDDVPVFIPSIAMHMKKKEADEALNPELHLKPLIGLFPKVQEADTLNNFLHRHLSYSQLLSFDLCLSPLEPPRYIGAHSELFASPRIDNLASAHAAVSAISQDIPTETALQAAIFWNHEEIGSDTEEGAGSSFFSDAMQRICLFYKMGEEERQVLQRKGLMLSLDVAHGLHPHYQERHDALHRPLLGKGIVLKSHVKRKYASSNWTLAKCIDLCKNSEIPHQHFVSRADMPCGSTIGPIFATKMGIPTADIGIPMLGMHSIRELMALSDHQFMALFLKNILMATS